MKKKIINSLFLGIFFISGWGIEVSEVFAVVGGTSTTSQSNATTGSSFYNNNINSLTPAQQSVVNQFYGGNANTVTADGKCGMECRAGLDAISANIANNATLDAAQAKAIADSTINGNTSPQSGTNNPECFDGDCVDTPPTPDDPNSMASPNFTLDPNNLSPSEKKYTGGTRQNFKTILANIGKYLLIATTTIAVLSIVVGGLMISTTGTSDRAAKGKTIIMLNIMAVVVALFSYSIIKFVSWIIA